MCSNETIGSGNEGAVPIINLPHQPYSASKLCASKRDFERIPIAL